MDIGRKGRRIYQEFSSGEDGRYRQIWIYAAVIGENVRSGRRETQVDSRLMIKTWRAITNYICPVFDFSLSRSNISAIARVTPYKLKRAVEEAEEDVSRLPAAHYIKCN